MQLCGAGGGPGRGVAAGEGAAGGAEPGHSARPHGVASRAGGLSRRNGLNRWREAGRGAGRPARMRNSGLEVTIANNTSTGTNMTTRRTISQLTVRFIVILLFTIY